MFTYGPCRIAGRLEGLRGLPTACWRATPTPKRWLCDALRFNWWPWRDAIWRNAFDKRPARKTRSNPRSRASSNACVGDSSTWEAGTACGRCWWSSPCASARCAARTFSRPVEMFAARRRCRRRLTRSAFRCRAVLGRRKRWRSRSWSSNFCATSVKASGKSLTCACRGTASVRYATGWGGPTARFAEYWPECGKELCGCCTLTPAISLPRPTAARSGDRDRQAAALS